MRPPCRPRGAAGKPWLNCAVWGAFGLTNPLVLVPFLVFSLRNYGRRPSPIPIYKKPTTRGKKPEVATRRRLWSIAHSISRPIIIYDSDRAGCQCQTFDCSDLLMATMGARPRSRVGSRAATLEARNQGQSPPPLPELLSLGGGCAVCAVRFRAAPNLDDGRWQPRGALLDWRGARVL
jgi:hypothetical protein